MKFTKVFREIRKEDANVAGGKGASLGEMTRAGIPVPPGFVVLADAFERFLDETDLGVEIDSILHKVDHRKMHTVENGSERIQALILAAKMPLDVAKEIKKAFKVLGARYVAVRSSATAEDSSTAAWAGQLDTYLNTTEKDLLKNVQRCWASLFTPRAIFYRFEKGLHKIKISVAVVVQKMVQSEVSGVAFSVHPVTQDRNQLIIEAGYGLGEAIVSGSITPDSYVVEKNGWRIFDKNISNQTKSLVRAGAGNTWQEMPESKAEKQKLSDKEILELSHLVVKIEEHYGFPVDIEWAREKGRFYITQSRPITTLAKIRQAQQDSKRRYIKTYTRETSLIALEIWEGQYPTLQEKVGTTKETPFTLYDSRKGLVEVYFEESVFDSWWKIIADKAVANKDFTGNAMRWYRDNLSKLEPIWRGKKQLKTKQDFVDFFNLATVSWAGLGLAYSIPELKKVAKKDRDLAYSLRVRSQNYLEDTDHIIQKTLLSFYPKLGDLVKYLTFEEVRMNKLPTKKELEARKKHYIYYGFKVLTNTSSKEFVQKQGIEIATDKIPANTKTLTGQVAMGGRARGRVRVLKNKAEISSLQEGEILVTAMTTPDFLPAMNKAAAFVTDEGGITSHAAIIAREMRKPCIIGTKYATQVLKNGDLVSVDADKGIVKILGRNF